MIACLLPLALRLHSKKLPDFPRSFYSALPEDFLFDAARRGDVAYPKVLIDSQIDVNTQNGKGGTALMFATLSGRNKLVKIMLEHGADTSLRDVRGLMALDLAIQQGNEEALQLLQ